MGREWIVHLKWQLGREEWRVLYFEDGDTITIIEVMERLINDLTNEHAVLPIVVEIVGPVKP